MLYRTNAQSRVIEDSLMRSGLSYRIVGGVRFYERKEIKDSLAYLKLLINPHDDVSLRRVINVPARGIGKGVLDALDRVSADEAPPLLLASGIAVPAPNSLWTKLTRAIDERLVPPRALTSLKTFRDLIVNLSDVARREPLSIALGKMLDQTGYLQDLRDDRSEDSQGRIENLMELVSAAREYEGREPEASLGGFTDKLSLLSEADEGQGSLEARIWLMTLHAAKGLEFPTVIMAGLEEGVFPHSRAFDDEDELAEERRLCYVGITRARAQLVHDGRSATARLRRVPVDGAVPLHGRAAAAARRTHRAGVSRQQLSKLVRRIATPTYHRPGRPAGEVRRRLRAQNPRIPTKTKISHRSRSVSSSARKCASSAIRRRDDPQPRRSGRRCEAGGEIFGGTQDASREIREAGNCLTHQERTRDWWFGIRD